MAGQHSMFHPRKLNKGKNGVSSTLWTKHQHPGQGPGPSKLHIGVEKESAGDSVSQFQSRQRTNERKALAVITNITQAASKSPHTDTPEMESQPIVNLPRGNNDDVLNGASTKNVCAASTSSNPRISTSSLNEEPNAKRHRTGNIPLEEPVAKRRRIDDEQVSSSITTLLECLDNLTTVMSGIAGPVEELKSGINALRRSVLVLDGALSIPSVGAVQIVKKSTDLATRMASLTSQMSILSSAASADWTSLREALKELQRALQVSYRLFAIHGSQSALMSLWSATNTALNTYIHSQTFNNTYTIPELCDGKVVKSTVLTDVSNTHRSMLAALDTIQETSERPQSPQERSDTRPSSARPSRSQPTREHPYAREMKDLKNNLMQRKSVSNLDTRTRRVRATSATGYPFETLGWMSDLDGPNRINRKNVADARRKAGLRDPADPMPESTQGLVFPTVETSLRKFVDDRMNAAGIIPERRRTDDTLLDRYLDQRGISLTPDQICVLNATKTNGAKNICLTGHAASGKSILGEVIAVTAAAPALLLLARKTTMQTARVGLKGFPDVAIHTPSTLGDLLFPAYKAWSIGGLRAARNARACPQWRGPEYSVIVVDEFNDCTPDLFWLVAIFLGCLPNFPRVTLLGDLHMTLNAYRGGDPRFLQLAPVLFDDFVSMSWRTICLQESLLTRSTTQFINNVYLAGSDDVRHNGSGDGPRPRFYHVGPGGMGAILDNIVALVEEYADSCALTVRSTKYLKRDHPLDCIVKQLRKTGTPVTQPKADTSHFSTNELRGKVVLANYNQVQGCHYKLVIVFSDDLKREDPARLVALTRASHQLVVIQPMIYSPPVPIHVLSQYADITRSPANISLRDPDDSSHGPFPRCLLASEIAAHVDVAILDALVAEYLVVTEVSACLPEPEHIQPRDCICTDREKGLYESVNDINGMIVTAGLKMRREDKDVSLQEQCSVLARRAIEDQSSRSGFTLRENALQENSCTWMRQHIVRAVDRLEAEFGIDEDLDMEPSMRSILPNGVLIRGCADVVVRSPSETTVTEVKLTAALTAGDIVQAATYGFLWAKQEDAKMLQENGTGTSEQIKATMLPRIILFNVRTGQKFQIGGKVGDVESLITRTIRVKYLPRETTSDDDFQQMVGKISSEVVSVYLDENNGRVSGGV
ncbi:hypothetical protein C8R43DRAFT_1113996 [Mycena crocata]|nr:hypothetical protein C8R43DRAFT_1113996 [Mycena crocata]